MSVTQKVALITGASSGIGECTAIELAKQGYLVAITGRSAENLARVAGSLGQPADRVLTIQADFEDPAQVDGVVGKVLDAFGRLDVLVNNAGYPGKGLHLEHENFFLDFQNIMQVNLMAATRLAQLAAPELKKNKGVLVNVSSVADRVGMASISYSVSKAGMSMLTKTLANALDGSGARVVTVSPGPIKTNFGRNREIQISDQFVRGCTSLHRFGQAEEVAQVIAFLVSEKASYVHGCTIDVDGGMIAKFNNLSSNFRKDPQSE